MSKRRSLLADSRLLFAVMPASVRRSARWAAVMASGLAAAEFLALFLIYPVFGYLANPVAGQAYQVPGVGVQVDRGDVRTLAIASLMLMIARSLLTAKYRRWWLGVTADAEVQLSEKVLRAYAHAPYEFHLDRSSSRLLSRTVANVNVVCQSGLVGVVGFAADLFLVVGLTAAVLVANPLVGLVVAGYVTLIAAVYSLVTRGVTARISQAYGEQAGQVYAEADVLLRGIREMTIFGLRDEQLQRASRSRLKLTDVGVRMQMLQELPRVVLEVAVYVPTLVALAVLLTMEDPGEALPLIALYIISALRIMPNLGRLLSGIILTRRGAQMAEELSAEIDALDAVGTVSEVREEIPAVRADLVLHDVGFGYLGSDRPVLAEVSLALPFGTFLGVVGESGSGKTTLTGILLGLLEPTAGAMTYGGFPVRARNTYWYERVAVVPQDVYLTPGSLRENILAGTPDDDERLAHAIDRAGLTHLVAELPEGVDTPMREGGSRLSAGQRQRVGLARALYRHPEVLVLDEPTSALDAETEQHVMQSIAALRGMMTIIVVAHRTHTLADTDLVVRLGEGRVLGVGKPAELLGGS